MSALKLKVSIENKTFPTILHLGLSALGLPW